METIKLPTGKTMYKIYYLKLADVRGGVDRAYPVIASFSLQRLMKYYYDQREPWDDEEKTEDFYHKSHTYQKTFKKGSPLEWFNDVENTKPTQNPSPFGGIGYEWSPTNNPNNIMIDII